MAKNHRTELTDAFAKSVELPAGITDRIYFDARVPQFGVRVRASGERSWIVQYYVGRVRKLTLGPISALPARKARQLAEEAMAEVKFSGGDPHAKKAESRAAAVDTVGKAIPGFLALQREKLRPRSLIEVERHLMKNAASLHNRAIADIDIHAANKFMDRLHATSARSVHNATLASLATFWGWMTRRGIALANPFGLIDKKANPSRDRVLTESELGEIWRASLDMGQYGTIVRLLMLTGARRSEISELRWSEINWKRKRICIPAKRSKTHRDYDIPITAPVAAILRGIAQRPDRDLVFGYGDFGFGDWNDSKRRLDIAIQDARMPGAAAMPEWVQHDFRRSMSTTMNQELDVWPHVVEACLNHSVKGVAAVYDKSDRFEDKRAAFDKWAAFVLAAAAPRKVLPFRKARAG